MVTSPKRVPVDSTDRFEILFKVHVTGRLRGESELANERVVKELEELADLAQQGVVRDFDFDADKITEVVTLAADFVRLALWNTPDAAAGGASAKGTRAFGAAAAAPPMVGKAGGQKGGFVQGGGTKAGTPMTVAPWMANPGASAPKPLKRPTGVMNCCPPPVGGQASKPMTVAPWIQVPGSSVGKVLGAAATPGGDEWGCVGTRGGIAACGIACKMLSIEETASAALSLGGEQLKQTALTACTMMDQLCSIGAGPSGAGRALGDDNCKGLVAALKQLLSAVYSRFPPLRACLRRRLSLSLSSWISRCSHVPRAQLGIKLHPLDGGPRASAITLVGASAGLELLAGIIKGFRRPPRAHMRVLWDSLMPIHSSNSMIDDVTPLLALIHKPLCLCEVAFLEANATCAGPLLRHLVSYWPPVSSSNSSKEVLLLHELELLLEHCRPEALDDCDLRDLVADLMMASFDSGKNFRVATRCLLLFKADGVVSLLRHHQAAIVPRMVPKLLAAAAGHWNSTVIRMLGNALQVLEEMDPDAFMQIVGPEKCEEVRAAVLRMCPPDDKDKLDKEAAARVGAMQARRDAGTMDLYCLAMGHELGDGAYSRVRYAKLIAKDLQQSLWPQVAVKIMDKEVVRSQDYDANVRREILVLGLLSHPAIVRFVGSFETQTSIYIALEYMPMGDLQQVLAQKGSLSVKSARFVTAEILSGLDHMHSHGIVYGDLKPENVLLDEKNHCKLSDFGSSRLIAESSHEAHGHRVEGTLDYISPEVAAGLSPSSFESDAWALGCVLFQLIAGHVPVPPEEARHVGADGQHDYEEGNKRALRHIVRFTETKEHAAGMFDDDFPEEPRGLLRRLLSVNASARLGGGRGLWGDVMVDPLFEGIDWEGLPSSEPPSLSTGMVSAATANDKRWNRRKQSMMYSPMPDKYVGGGTGDVTVLAEEDEGTSQLSLPEHGPGSGESDDGQEGQSAAEFAGLLGSSLAAAVPPSGSGDHAMGRPPVPAFAGGGRPPQPPGRLSVNPSHGGSTSMVIDTIAESE